jgi:hypothetical protein
MLKVTFYDISGAGERVFEAGPGGVEMDMNLVIVGGTIVAALNQGRARWVMVKDKAEFSNFRVEVKS